MATPNQAAAPPQICGRCGSQGTFYPALNQYGCDKCQMIPLQAAVQGSPGPMAGGYNPYAQAMPPSLACPQCRLPATFYPQTNQWGCDRCRIPVTPPPLQLRPSGGSDAGMVALRVIGTIVLLIILGVIKFALLRH